VDVVVNVVVDVGVGRADLEFGLVVGREGVNIGEMGIRRLKPKQNVSM